MNIESKTIPASSTQKNEIQAQTIKSSDTKEVSSTFKDELETAKGQENTENSNAQSSDSTTINKTSDDKTKTSKISSKNNTPESEKTDENIANSLNALNFKIAAINEIKNNSNIKTHTDLSISKTDNKSDDHFKNIKMNQDDAMFFLNLIQNQQLSAQTTPIIGNNVENNQLQNFTEIKTNAAQSTTQVSAALLNALNNAAKTGKSFRIDFDNNIAVIMKVDKEGTLSANFIPGSAAVEQYLRNNIAGLRQNFDNQGLPYNQLSYSKHQQQEQKEQQNNKENGNE
jgi:hypothetical protein